MSQPNVEIVRRMYDAYGRGDLQTSFSCFDAHVEYAEASYPGSATYHGHDGLRRGAEKWAGTWDEYRVYVEELTDLGDHVLAKTRSRGHGKGGGVPVEMELFALYTLRAGKIVQLRMFYERAAALAAAGVDD
jgi:ketosteroid isomerase-like protein